MDELPIGRRVAYWRGRRKMSQQVFADRLGKSKSWVDKVERGVRRLDKFSVLYEIADILQLDVQLLLGKDPERRTDTPNCIEQFEVEEIRAALETYDAVSAYFHAAPCPPPLADTSKAVTHAWLTYQYGRYGMLTRALPKLLRDAQAADAAYASGDQAQRAAHLLGQVYQIASSVLRKLGESELAWLAADRSIAVAQRADDQLLAGVATTRVSNALVAMGRARPALELNVNIANRLAPGGGNDTSPERLSVYGMLLLQGAMAASRIGDTASVDDLLGEAYEAARELGGDQNHYWTSFGPTNVELHRAAAAVELGDGGRAVEVHQRIKPPQFDALLPERRAHHLLDLARGYAQIGDVANAGEMLLRGDRLAPAEIRCRPIAHVVMSDVLRRTRGAPPSLIAELAEHMGVGV
ncbi:helix-turn-helix domain-containing protein [Micromonospora endophytica]|uniref:Transcriptional regulator n=1 Tax=Micromonospora endophytica TaxID=515350 RepID=A0A2W2CKV9_9ACTN|nr:helix-turn-helix domain-containing protein [Micromonospora endophytica]PZG00076.1 transcriptional regulator [Micromonospora endophytica]RIW47050.1 XRE family transcriptional regulator [Micromonospora endophytica]BCJ60982.1 transcriptional regulator [Micromonospora endophytica]